MDLYNSLNGLDGIKLREIKNQEINKHSLNFFLPLNFKFLKSQLEKIDIKDIISNVDQMSS